MCDLYCLGKNVVLLSILAVGACGDNDPPLNPDSRVATRDGSLPVLDSGTDIPDSTIGLPDSSLPGDAMSMLDSGVLDSGVLDSGMLDSGVLDSGMLDSGMLDSAVSVDAASNGDIVPANSGTLFPYLQARMYDHFAAETAVHSSTGPHGKVRTFINDILDNSLNAGNISHPAGAATVKELYQNDGVTLLGWAVMVKTDDDSAGGLGWYWYEIFSTTDDSNPVADGNGVSLCYGCHSSGADYFLSPYPLQ